MKKFNCEWLVVIIIHDFKHPKYSPIIDEIVKEFEDEGISDDNCVLYIHDELVDADNGIFKTSFNRLERDVINTSRFVFNKVTDAEFRFDKGRTWEKVLQFIKEEYISFKRSVMITLSDGAGF